MLVDGLLLVRAARIWGVYLALAIEASTALLAALIVGSSLSRIVRQLRREAYHGHYVARHYAQLYTVIIAATLLWLPGFAGDLLGLILYLPPGRQLFALWLAHRSGETLRSVYEYLKIDLFSTTSPPGPRDDEQPIPKHGNHQDGPQQDAD